MKRRIGAFAVLSLVAAGSACTSATSINQTTPIVPVDTNLPPITREMRGMWIATVGNIDWPTRSTLSSDQQRGELVDIVTRANAAGLNTIVFQVRSAADALYQSSLEPWSSVLTGTQGTDPGYDPLAFVIQEAHKRGLELHAWINPFRAGSAADSAKLASTHVFNTRRDLVRVYGSTLWLDPGEPDVQDRTMAAILDIVRRYDIDGIHADDYFYPYVQNDAAGKPIAFPDDATYAKYGAGLPRDDWRRANVDRFVERMYREVHAIKPTIKVGISPFGIWRPGNPPSVQGLDAYATIYADSRKWLQQGWLDYIAPQLYWSISAPQQSFPALLDWWIQQNSTGRHVWPGLAAYRVNDGTSSAYSMSEIPDEIRATRQRPGATGELLYNTTWTLKQNGGALANTLAGDLYKSAALVPPSTWLDATPPPPPIVTVSTSRVDIAPGAGEAPRWWVVRQHTPESWKTSVLFADERSLTIGAAVDRVLVQAADEAGNLSSVAEWRKP
jgi:uncharacterized lipoprotein YddW (UPF0748 family)